MYATLLGDIDVIDDFSVRECCHLQEPLEGIQIPHQRLFLDFLFQVDVDVGRQQPPGVAGQIVRGNSAIVYSAVYIKIGYFGTD